MWHGAESIHNYAHIRKIINRITVYLRHTVPMTMPQGVDEGGELFSDPAGQSSEWPTR